jgi:hypothetical protein
MAKKQTITPADRAIIAAATEFTAYLRISPTKKIVERFDSLAGAARRAEELRAEHKGRGVLVYAIGPEGQSVPVPAEDQAAALATPAADESGIPAFLRRKAPAPAEIQEDTEMAPEPASAKPDPAVVEAMQPGNERTIPAAPKGKRATAEAAARAGNLPTPPDFSAATHARFRKKLDEVVALAKAGDLAGLRSFSIKPVSSSPKAIDRYRNLCILALEATPGR